MAHKYMPILFEIRLQLHKCASITVGRNAPKEIFRLITCNIKIWFRHFMLKIFFEQSFAYNGEFHWSRSRNLMWRHKKLKFKGELCLDHLSRLLSHNPHWNLFKIWYQPYWNITQYFKGNWPTILLAHFWFSLIRNLMFL